MEGQGLQPAVGIGIEEVKEFIRLSPEKAELPPVKLLGSSPN